MALEMHLKFDFKMTSIDKRAPPFMSDRFVEQMRSLTIRNNLVHNTCSCSVPFSRVNNGKTAYRLVSQHDCNKVDFYNTRVWIHDNIS